MRKPVFCLFLSSVLCFLFSGTAFAAGTLSVIPQIIQLDLSKDAPIATFTYKNTTATALELGLSIEDVKELEETGIPGFVPPDQAGTYKYGLSSWASLSTENLVLEPGEEKAVLVTIDKTRLTLGGHYASVLAELKQKEGGKNVKLKAILAALLFVRSGSEFDREDAKIASFLPSSNFFSFPEQFIVRFQNTGNVDVTPHGLIEIYDFLGRRVARGIVNDNSLICLPETIRKINVKINKDSNILVPGIYRANLSIHFGNADKKISSSATFFSLGSLNPKYIIVIVILLVVIIYAQRQKFKKAASIFKNKRGNKSADGLV